MHFKRKDKAMAKVGNKSDGEGGRPKGPCVDCGAVEATFSTLCRISVKGKKAFVTLCTKCMPKA